MISCTLSHAQETYPYEYGHNNGSITAQVRGLFKTHNWRVKIVILRPSNDTIFSTIDTTMTVRGSYFDIRENDPRTLETVKDYNINSRPGDDVVEIYDIPSGKWNLGLIFLSNDDGVRRWTSRGYNYIWRNDSAYINININE
jgi:hypothetical protein